MSQYSTELQNFIMGNIRAEGDPFRSDWRREQERRRAEEMGKCIFVAAPQIQERQVRARKPQIARTYSDPERRREIVRTSLQKRRLRLKAEGICVDCGSDPVKEGRTSCERCLKARYARQKRQRLGRAA